MLFRSVSQSRYERQHLAHINPILLEKQTTQQILLVVRLTTNIIETLHNQQITFELADHDTYMNVIDTNKTHPLHDHTKTDTVHLLTHINTMSRTMQIQDHVVLAHPITDRLNNNIADHEIDHDDHRAQLLNKLNTLVHVFHRHHSDIKIIPLHLATNNNLIVTGKQEKFSQTTSKPHHQTRSKQPEP